MLGPLPRRSEIRDAVIAAAGHQIWTDVVEKPIGEAIIRRFRDDTVRGVVATDGVIGTHTSLFDPELLANRCFLYHLIGRGAGEWLVPIGGMGALTDALTAAARALGVEIRCGVDVINVQENATAVTVTGSLDGKETSMTAGHVLAAVAPAVIDGWLGREQEIPTGAQIKINMLLDRLPDWHPALIRRPPLPAPCTSRRASGISKRLMPQQLPATCRQSCRARCTATRCPTRRS